MRRMRKLFLIVFKSVQIYNIFFCFFPIRVVSFFKFFKMHIFSFLTTKKSAKCLWFIVIFHLTREPFNLNEEISMKLLIRAKTLCSDDQRATRHLVLGILLFAVN